MSLHDSRLPFLDRLDGPEFEAFCHDLIARTPGFERVRRWGVSGDAQEGIDILAEREGEDWAFQCKCEAQFGAAKVSTAIAAATRKADRYVLLLGRPATAQARSTAEGLGWEVWDADDLSQRVRVLPPDSAVQLVRAHFGEPIVRSFLGINHDTPWLPLEEAYDDLLNPQDLFTHAWSFVGRTAALGALMEDSGDEWITVLPGRGGIGKSRLLLEAGRRLMADGATVRMVAPDRVVRPEHADLIPHGDPTVLLLDDAHRYPDLASVARAASAARRRGPGRVVRLMLATRPHGVDAVRSALSQAGVDPAAIRQLPELNTLSGEELRELAQNALGPLGSDDFVVERLVQAIGDSPLVLTVGAQLVGRGNIDLVKVRESPTLLEAVLDRFREEALGRVPDGIPEADARSVLEIVAAIGPLATDAAAVLDAAADAADLRPAAFRRALGGLEKAGVLARRGRQVRISPDVLGDHVLAESALFPDGSSNGFAERVYRKLAPVAGPTVLRNLAELDWRQRRGGAAPDLLGEVWADIEVTFRQGDAATRVRVLELVGDAAYYLPRQVLSLCQLALDAPPPETSGKDELGVYQKTSDDVLAMLPELLRRVGFTIDVLPEALDLLWRLAQGEGDVLRPYPAEAQKVLKDLAAPGERRPIEVQRAVLDRAEFWARDQARQIAALDDLSEGLPQFPISQVLGSVLNRKTETSWYSEGAFYIRNGFPWAQHPVIRSVRRRALELLEEYGRMGGPVAAVSVVEVLHRTVRNPPTPDVPPYPGVIQAFESEARWALVIIARLLEVHPDPYLADAVWQRLAWFATQGRTEARRAAAAQLRCRAADIPGWPLVRALHRPRDLAYGRRGDGWHSDYITEQAEAKERAAREFLSLGLDPSEAVVLLDSILERLTQIDAWGAMSRHPAPPQPSTFLTVLGRLDPGFGVALADLVKRQGLRSGSAQVAIGALLTGVRDAGAGDGLLRALLRGDAIARKAAALAIHDVFWSGTPSNDDWGTLATLLSDSDSEVVLQAIQAWRGALHRFEDTARPYLFHIDLVGKHQVATLLYEALELDIGDSLTEPEVAHFLDAFRTIPSIEQSGIQEFLRRIATRAPERVFDLLWARIEGLADPYEAIPYVYHGSLFDESPPESRSDILRRALLAGAEFGDPARAYSAQRLAGQLAHGHPEPVRAVILDALRGRDDVAEVALDLLADMPERLPLEDAEYTIALRRAASEGGGIERRTIAERRIRSAVTMGSRTRGFCQPSEKDVFNRDEGARLAVAYADDPSTAAFFQSISDSAKATIAADLASDEEGAW